MGAERERQRQTDRPSSRENTCLLNVSSVGRTPPSPCTNFIFSLFELKLQSLDCYLVEGEALNEQRLRSVFTSVLTAVLKHGY